MGYVPSEELSLTIAANPSSLVLCVTVNESDTPQGGHVNCVRFPTMPCVYREEEVVMGRGGGAESLLSRTEPLFASGITMETRALFIERLGCSHSPAVYHSHHMVEANGAQFKARRNFFYLLLQRWRVMEVVSTGRMLCGSTLTLAELAV